MVSNYINLDKIEEYNENFYAIYIHIIADALGSVSVVISSFLIRFYGLNFCDPLCSLIIAGMIIYATWPIICNSCFILMHKLNDKLEDKKKKIEKEVKSIISLSLMPYLII